MSVPANALDITQQGLVKFDGSTTFTGVTVTQHDVLVGAASNGITSVAPSATTGVALVSQGAAADPAFGTVVVAGGGTGATTLTGVVTGNGTSAFTASPVTQYDVLVGGASNAISSVGPGSAGQVLQSGGAAANPAYSTATYPSTSGTSGTLLQSNGTNFVNSTATYPSTAGTSGTILQSNGTNWINSTPTYPTTAGTSGNVLTSDGTNWVSSPPAAGSGSYSLQMQVDNGNPLDSTSYFMGYSMLITQVTSSNATSRAKLYIPKTGTITTCYGNFRVSGTLASSENTTLAIRLNNTTDNTVTSTLQLTSSSNAVANGALSIAVTAGDFIEFKWTTPAWVTNPTSVSCSLTVFVSV